MKEIDVEFDKIVGEGKTLGRKQGKIVFSYGVLPGETAKIRVIKEKKNFIEGEVVEIFNRSPHRIEPKEEHYISCSPYQIMDYDFQMKVKRNITQDLLYQTTKEDIRLENFYGAKKIWGYRTKIEYSFTEKEGHLALAFHKRGDYSRKVFLPSGCALIDEKANKVAFKILEKLNQKGIKKEQVKTLTVRMAKNTQDILACLYVKDENIDISCIDLLGEIKGFVLIYSSPLSSISSIDKVIKTEGLDFISEKIAGLDISYSFDCFFQNNIDLFEAVLMEIKNECSNDLRIVDMYSGVGVIGFYLKDCFKDLISIESFESSVKYAFINAEKNNVKNYKIFNIPSEKMGNDLLRDIDTLILDPPRAGLHKNVIKSIMSNLPQKIIYLSCNPITQGRDVAYFLEKYKIKRALGFDFYPNTSHIENLLILEKK